MQVTIDAKERALLTDQAPAAEKSCRLTGGQLDMIYENQWFLMFVPAQLGGLELPLPKALQLEETLAEIDGSLGWTVTLCAGAGWFAGFLDPGIWSKVFFSDRSCVGGSGAPSGKAEHEEGGYRISGNWNFATGAPHLTHFTANCVIWKDGQALKNPDGSPVIRSFIFDKSEVTTINNWHAMGLIATASHSFSVRDLWLPSTHCFNIAPDKVTLPDAIYRYPFGPFAEVTLAVNYAGMARHFLQESKRIFERKNVPALLEKHRRQQMHLEKIRSDFYETINQSWQWNLSNKLFDTKLTNSIGLQSRKLAKASLDACFALFPYCGMEGADRSSTLNRIWRDLFTASQHIILFPPDGE